MASAVVAYTHNANGGTDVSCKNIFTGKIVTRTLKIDPTMLLEWHNSRSMTVQNAFPHLSEEDREFLMTGLSKEEWDQLNLEDEDD